MRKLLAAIFVVAIFAACDNASASGTNLTGSITIVNPSASWKAPQTINYNAIYSNMQLCEDARTAAINEPLSVYPAAATPSFGTFYKVVMLNCTAKTLVE